MRPYFVRLGPPYNVTVRFWTRRARDRYVVEHVLPLKPSRIREVEK